jgi:hypothetical protein
VGLFWRACAREFMGVKAPESRHFLARSKCGSRMNTCSCNIGAVNKRTEFLALGDMARGSRFKVQGSCQKVESRRECGENAQRSRAARSSVCAERLSACTRQQRVMCNIVHYLAAAVKRFCVPRQDFVENCWNAALTEQRTEGNQGNEGSRLDGRAEGRFSPGP